MIARNVQRSFPVSSCSGSSLFNECVRMLEAPSTNECSIAAGSRVAASPGSSAGNVLPAALHQLDAGVTGHPVVPDHDARVAVQDDDPDIQLVGIAVVSRAEASAGMTVAYCCTFSMKSAISFSAIEGRSISSNETVRGS